MRDPARSLLAAADARERGERRGRERRERAGLLRGRRVGEGLRGAPGGYRGAQRVHRLGTGGQGAQRRQHGLGDRRCRQVMVRIPFAGPQQVRDGGVRAVLDEVPDSVAPVEELAPLAVDVAEGRLGGDYPLEAGGIGTGVGHASMVAAVRQNALARSAESGAARQVQDQLRACRSRRGSGPASQGCRGCRSAAPQSRP